MTSDEIQHVDDYVKRVLRFAKDKYQLDINPENPTREQRLEAAVAMFDESHGYNSYQIMTGWKITSEIMTSNQLLEFCCLGIDRMDGVERLRESLDRIKHDYKGGTDKV